MHTEISTYRYIFICLLIHVYIHTYIHIHSYIYMYISLWVCIHIRLCVYAMRARFDLEIVDDLRIARCFRFVAVFIIKVPCSDT